MSSHLPCPPPYLYGFLAMRLPASMIAWTSGGASVGATARPSGPTTALPVAGAASGLRELDSTVTRSALASGRETFPSTLRCLLGLPGADLASRAAAELAVDVSLEARAGQVVLEDADVTSTHPLMQGTLPEDLLGGRRGGNRYGHESESH